MSRHLVLVHSKQHFNFNWKIKKITKYDSMRHAIFPKIFLVEKKNKCNKNKVHSPCVKM